MNALIENIIAELGSHLGFKNLKLSTQGRLHISMDKLGELFIEVTPQEEIRFSLSRKHPYPSRSKYLYALELCHYSQPTQNSHLYTTGLIGENTFFFSTVLETDHLLISEVMNTLQTLIRLQDALKNAH